ncbi:carbohydrate binding domain-containing protein, partial [Ligilactobacillus agilis]|uniref:carbohydrate binding domain-containing protein n=1 Tax=Ligilactobacillus agilis TaxID=1601 RepID=UPI003F8A7D4C
NKLRDVMGALKLDSNGKLTSNFNELIKTASGVEERYTQLNSKINGIVVGGKNLLDGTADFNSTYWYAANGTADIMQINGKTAVRGLKNWEGRRYKGTIQLEPNTDYTVSVYVRVNGGSGNGLNLGFYCNLDGNGDSWGLFNLGTLSTEWKRVALKWHNNNHREMTIPRVEWSGDFGTGWGSGFTAELQL